MPLAEACSFDRKLWEETARDNAIEAAVDGVHMTFAPMLDVARDARWGRIVECAGEDPLVNAEYGRARVRGYQKPDAAGFMRLAACAKHFCAYGAVISGRDYGEADVSQRALEEVYLPPFRAVVEEGVAAIMPAFVDVAGVAMTAHKRLLREVLRAQWRFDGLDRQRLQRRRRTHQSWRRGRSFRSGRAGAEGGRRHRHDGRRLSSRACPTRSRAAT